MRKLNLFFIFFTIILFMPLAAKALPTVPPGYTIEIYASGIPNPMGLDLDSQGNIFVGDDSSSVYKITPDGQVSLFGSGMSDTEGVAVDSSDNIFISGNGNIWKITQSGLRTNLATGFSNLNGIAVDNLDNLYVADLGAGKIFEVAQDGSYNLFSSAVQAPSDVVFNSSGELFVSDVGFKSILKVSPNGSVTSYYPEVGVPAFHPSGDLYLANPTLASVGEILRITPAKVSSTFATGFQHPRGLVFDSSNNLFVSDKHAGIIYKISPLIEVSIDIKPNSCPNSLNIDPKGILTVAVHGTPDLDITTIDPASVRLEGVAPIRSSVNDVATPILDPQSVCECNSEGKDGFDDLVLKFSASDLIDAIFDPQVGDVVELTLIGTLTDGTPIEGQDCIVCVKKGKKD